MSTWTPAGASAAAARGPTSPPPSQGAPRCSGTAARAAQLLEHILGAAEFDAAAGLAALAKREKAEAALDKGNAAEAEALLNEVIGLNACGGLQLAYRSRSKARLAIGDISGALKDAEEAIRIAPRFPQAHLL
ncbi:unnamed protein product [Urochloa humidicola]